MSEPMGAGARADYACKSKKCATEDGAPTYELPVTAKRCPVCGSTRIMRLWSGKAPGLLRSGMREMQHVIDATGSDAYDRMGTQRDARLGHEKQARELADAGVNTSIRMVPVGQVGAGLASIGIGAPVALPTGKGAPSGMNAPLLAGTVAGRRVPPRIVKEYKPTSQDMRKAGG